MLSIDSATFSACDEHAEMFLTGVRNRWPDSDLESWSRPAREVTPVVIDDFRRLSEENKNAIRKAYESVDGVASFIVRNPDMDQVSAHPLFDITEQLQEMIPVRYPLRHPMEGHAEAVARFGPADGTTKIYDLPGRGGSAGYREQAETNETFDFHHDGLGSGGTVETVLLYMDSPPLYGGYTYFVNIPAAGFQLSRIDREAFNSLFLPNAITIIRPRGKGAIKVVTPVLFLNELDQPQSFFRVKSGEYKVSWLEYEPLRRASAFLDKFVPPFSPGSSFVHLSARGHGCISNNQIVAHARTPFRDDPERGLVRLLSRKWYMRSERDTLYKHVPGMFLSERVGPQYSSIRDPYLLKGEWNYDGDLDQNLPKKEIQSAQLG